MHYGVHTFIWTKTFDESNLALLPQLKEWGFDGIEIARYQFDDFPAKKIGEAVRKNELAQNVGCDRPSKSDCSSSRRINDKRLILAQLKESN